MPRLSNLLSAAVLGLCTSSALAAEILVKVGGPGVLKFDPEFVTANVDDIVVFQFQQKNHTATQSTLTSPCTPMEGGFDTGFVPVADDVTEADFPIGNLLITDTEPTWVYCRQGNHCQQGMVFAINPADKFEEFKNAATGNVQSTSAGSSSTAAGSVVTVTATVTVSGDVQTTTYQTTAPTSTSSGSESSIDHKVVVGGTGGLLTYEPSNIQANAGDTVTFEFRQKNHTVTQSTFAAPCRKVELTSTTGEVGFDSGFMAVAADATTFPTYTIQVNDTKPIWAYCRQGNHCGQGMVFSVNAPSSGNTFDAFQEKAVQLNGTGSSGGAGAADGAVVSQLNGAGVILAALAAIAGALL